MSCNSGACAQGFFPDPNNRSTSGRAYQVNNPRATGAARRPTYFSPTLHRASAVVHNPTSITLRELAVVALAVFALYKAFFVVAAANRLLLGTPVSSVCPRQAAAFGCAWLYLSHLWRLVAYGWAGAVMPWAFVAAVAVFFGEEAVAMLRGRR